MNCEEMKVSESLIENRKLLGETVDRLNMVKTKLFGIGKEELSSCTIEKSREPESFSEDIQYQKNQIREILEILNIFERKL